MSTKARAAAKQITAEAETDHGMGEALAAPAEALKITAKNHLEFGLVDEVVPEPLGGAHTDPDATAETLRTVLLKHLEELLKMSAAERLQKRYAKFRAFGHFSEKPPAATEQAGA